MQKRALILNTNHNDVRMILALKEMGFYVIATGNCPGLVGEQYVDEYIPMDYSDREAILNLAQKKHLDAICACCNDFGVLTAAYVAEKMGLPGHDTYENALTLHHKDRFKKFAGENGIPTPASVYFSDEQTALDWCRETTYPLIVKPTDLSAGRGVTKINTFAESTAAIRNAFAVSRRKKIVVEPFIDGSQHACCAFLLHKKVVAVCTNNEYSLVNPYRIEIDTYPADNAEFFTPQLINETEKMARLLNLKDGIFHLQYRVKDGKPYIIEVMRRVLGNLYGIPAEKLTGINWDYWEARTHCGLDCAKFPQHLTPTGFYAYRAVMATQNGPVKKIIIPDDLKKYIFAEVMLWKPEVPINDYMAEPLGFLFFEFTASAEMDAVMLKQYDKIYAEY